MTLNDITDFPFIGKRGGRYRTRLARFFDTPFWTDSPYIGPNGWVHPPFGWRLRRLIRDTYLRWLTRRTQWQKRRN
jgi:hypothetical protein